MRDRRWSYETRTERERDAACNVCASLLVMRELACRRRLCECTPIIGRRLGGLGSELFAGDCVRVFEVARRVSREILAAALYCSLLVFGVGLLLLSWTKPLVDARP